MNLLNIETLKREGLLPWVSPSCIAGFEENKDSEGYPKEIGYVHIYPSNKRKSIYIDIIDPEECILCGSGVPKSLFKYDFFRNIPENLEGGKSKLEVLEDDSFLRGVVEQVFMKEKFFLRDGIFFGLNMGGILYPLLGNLYQLNPKSNL